MLHKQIDRIPSYSPEINSAVLDDVLQWSEGTPEKIYRKDIRVQDSLDIRASSLLTRTSKGSCPIPPVLRESVRLRASRGTVTDGLDDCWKSPRRGEARRSVKLKNGGRNGGSHDPAIFHFFIDIIR